MPPNGSFPKDVIPLLSRIRVPVSVEQEPVRTRSAPEESPVNVQAPKLTLHGALEHVMNVPAPHGIHPPSGPL